MNLPTLKRRHWVVIGTLAGVAVGISRIMSREQEQIGGEEFVTQRQFEDAVCATPVNGKPFVTGMVIHPGSLDVVTFRGLNASSGAYYDYSFAAQHPYTPLTPIGPAGLSDTISDYLLKVAAAHPDVSFKYAWWEAWWATLSMHGIFGLTVIGGVWPTVVRRIRGPESKDREYDLNRFANGSKQPDKSIPTRDDQSSELEEPEHVLPVESAARNAVAESTTTALLLKLKNTPIEPLVAPATSLKDYAGEYYPVEKHTTHGFTLVELLVVIGIVALLFSFMMPTLRLVRMHAQTVQCASQLRQIGFALHAYAGDNHDWLPAWSGWHTWPAEQMGDSYGPAWTIELIPYIGTPDSPVYNCPSFHRDGRYRNYFLAAQWAGLSHRQAMKLSDITMSSRFVLSGDKTNLSFYPPNPAGDDADPDDSGAGMLLWPWTGGIYMHWRGNNVLFDDGHVALFGGYDKYEMTFHPRRMQDYGDVTAE